MQNYFAKNIIVNGGFETGSIAPWVKEGTGSVSAVSTEGTIGKYSGFFEVTNGNPAYIKQEFFPCYPGMMIPVFFKGKTDTVAIGEVQWLFYDADKSYLAVTAVNWTEGLGAYWHWLQFGVRAHPVGAFFGIRFRVYTAGGPASLYIDCVHSPAIPLALLNEKSKIASSENHYWKDQSGKALTNAFVSQSFGFRSQEIMLSNDSNTKYIEFSFGGTAVDGKILPREVLNLGNQEREEIYLRGESGGESYRLMAE